MMELNVTLGFACCHCAEWVTVTVQCSGAKAKATATGLPAVRVPCPGCHTINQLSFDADGTVRSVRPCVCYGPLPEPSVN